MMAVGTFADPVSTEGSPAEGILDPLLAGKLDLLVVYGQVVPLNKQYRYGIRFFHKQLYRRLRMKLLGYRGLAEQERFAVEEDFAPYSIVGAAVLGLVVLRSMIVYGLDLYTADCFGPYFVDVVIVLVYLDDRM